VASGSLIGISLQGKYFFHMNSAMVNVLYFSLVTNDFDIVDPDEEVTRPQGYTTAGASVMYLPHPNPSYMPSLPSVQSNNPQPVFFQNSPPVLPETTMPLFDISTITHPNVQGSFNIRYSPTFSDDQLLGIFPANNAIEPLESLYFNQMYPSNSPGYHQPGASTPPDCHYPHSTSEPVASSSRQTLADIQPGLYHREADYPTSDVKAEPENNVLIPDLPLEPRQKQSKNRRQQPYDRRKRGTRRREATSTIVPSNFDPAPAIASFLNRQAIICPILVKGNLCGRSVNTAQEMTDHLFETHRVDSKKSCTANVGLGGVCPHCGSRLTSCIYRHLMSDFYRYACPVEGCNKTYSRPDQLRGHCKSHGFQILSKANEEFAVRK
jgi:hypothetical protein